ncbi:hypothetical protein [Thalassomonas sp. RHCl1]|uniref:hypothetical protein n=1 Tax=Thalassomonas sp. RHCl1 TaxID=2995320 RepID=UPI00248BBC12|nr:hypothetical protein [Thalassomonas sp. RHCl1]
MTLSVTNIFDEDIYHPDHSTGGQNGVPFRVSSIPWGSGRAWFLSLKWPLQIIPGGNEPPGMVINNKSQD